MIIGDGMLAQAVQSIDNESCLFFCSGVSNSNEENIEKYEREVRLLEKFFGTNQRLIYFSSYFVNFDSFLKKKYYRYKSNIEGLILDNFSNFLIFRLPQIVGFSKNKNTLTNFLYDSIVSNSTIQVFKNAKRNILDIDDVVRVINLVINQNLFDNQVVNLVALRNYTIDDIIFALEQVTNKKAKKKQVTIEEPDYEILISEQMISLYHLLNIQFDHLYLERIIKKYYTERTNNND